MTDTDEGGLAVRHSRRHFLGLAGSAAAAAAFLAACGSEDDPAEAEATSEDGASATPTATAPAASTATTTADGGWEYTDATGATVTLEKAPERIVAWVGLASILYDFGVQSVGIWGPSRDADGNPTQQAGRMDLDAVESLTNDYSEMNLEALAVLRPDVLFVSAYSGTIWPIPEDEVKAIQQICPVVAIGVNGRPADEIIAEMEALAATLAAPRIEGAEAVVAEAKAEFEAASEELREIASANPGMTVIALSPATDVIWIAGWTRLPDLLYFTNLGVAFYPPEEEVNAADYSPQLTWETVNKYPTDAILLDVRPQWQVAEEDRAGTWQLLPAVQAGQIGGWQAEGVLSYQGYGPILRTLSEQLRGFSGDVVDEAAA